MAQDVTCKRSWGVAGTVITGIVKAEVSGSGGMLAAACYFNSGPLSASWSHGTSTGLP